MSKAMHSHEKRPNQERGSSLEPPRTPDIQRGGSGDPPRSGSAGGRRRFLEAAVRWPLLGAIGLLAGRLFARRATDQTGPLDPHEQCANRGLCRGCRALAACRSPQAHLFRRAEEERP